MSNSTNYDPRAVCSTKARSADAALAHHNTAAMALLDALREQLRPAHGANWGDVGSAASLVETLMHAYASRQPGFDSGEVFELPTDGGRGPTMRFTLEGF